MRMCHAAFLVSVANLSHYTDADTNVSKYRNSPNYRAAQRKAEADVRAIVLKLCGIALSRPQCPPALLIGVVAILLYGDYFIDIKEREALIGIIERTENMRAWSMRTPLEVVMGRWNSIDIED